METTPLCQAAAKVKTRSTRPAATVVRSGTPAAMAEMTLGGKETFHSKLNEEYPLLMSSSKGLFRVPFVLRQPGIIKPGLLRATPAG